MKVKPAQKGEVLALVAPLLDYPCEDFFNSLDTVANSIQRKCPDAYKNLIEFKKSLSDLNREELEELYTRTFDVAPVCSPYVSVHIYGDENFDRGNLMATLATKFEERGFKNGTELPDHLAVLLKFAKYLTDEELSELIEFCLNEPVENMSNSLKGSKKSNPYYHLFLAVGDILNSKRFL